jgi:hypothetical protein
MSGYKPSMADEAVIVDLTVKLAASQAEIERLRKALVYEENRFNRVGTHGPDCYQWGPSHYECAMREITLLTEQLQTVFVRWQDDKENWRQELAESGRNDQYSMKLLAETQAREAKLRELLNGKCVACGNPYQNPEGEHYVAD